MCVVCVVSAVRDMIGMRYVDFVTHSYVVCVSLKSLCMLRVLRGELCPMCSS